MKNDYNPADTILFTDFYQLTMAQLYFLTGMHEQEVQFDYFFRHYPDYGEHQAGYCVNAGLGWLLDWMDRSRFGKQEAEYLQAHKGGSGKPLFDRSFLTWLTDHGDFSGISIRAVPEGRIVHPHAPVAVVRGPFAMAQILETPLLNHLNYQTLVATKAARIREAANGSLTIDFGMRRAQGEGANEGTRAALIGGVHYSSNTGLSFSVGFPPKGTHAHSLVQAFLALGKSEREAFEAYADVYPDDCLLLVDTVDTLGSGIPNAIKVFEKLKRKGHVPLGIRLDSGDLAFLSVQAAKMLNDAGFPDVSIVLSNQLDELVIWQIASQIRVQAPQSGLDADRVIRRLSYGVGTSLLTSKGAGALDGVYKLTAIREKDRWRPALKISDSPGKTVIPGNKQVWRVYDRRGKATADCVGCTDEHPFDGETLILHHPFDSVIQRVLRREEIVGTEPLLRDVLVRGRLVGEIPSIEDMRKVRTLDMERLDAGVKRLINPHVYHVSLTEKLHALKHDLILSLGK